MNHRILQSLIAQPILFSFFILYIPQPAACRAARPDENSKGRKRKTFAARPNRPRVALLPESKTTYFLMIPGAPHLSFIKNGRGRFGKIVFSRDERDDKGQRTY